MPRSASQMNSGMARRLIGPVCPPPVEAHAEVSEQEEWPTDHPEPDHPPRDESRLVHQVAEDQPAAAVAG
jgi:hypothetical protein